ncbi:MAG TPA: adenylate/guanylate cyclase domain-containing protein [Geminicoccaceae bacterium]|nr:adenylate/guanylate cyclase domain-containing protein [Geminicoccaceae bacterium]
MARIVSLPDGVEFDAHEGETLLAAALRADLPLTHACGGRAKCSTCRVWVLAGLERCSSRTEAERALAGRLGLGDEVRLACQLRPCGDLRVRRLVLDETDLLLSSQLDRSVANRAGEVRDVTVFFSDIVGFTTIAETLPPYDVMHLLNRYFVQAGELIERNGGYIDKFLGDGMMALFGVDGQEDAPIRAVNAALQTLAAIDRMKPYMKAMYGLDFEIRIGLHHGEALLGSVGTLGHERLTAIGEVVNIASRVEEANKEAGTRLLISEALHRLVADQVHTLDFLRTRLRGTRERITLYEIDRIRPEVEAALNACEMRGSERHAGRTWLHAFCEDELAVGERRILRLERCDVVVHRGQNGYVAFNNACPHVRLPFFDPRPPPAEHRALQPPRQSMVTEDLGIVCRWHGSCYDLQTGEIRDWCPLLNADGTALGFEFLGDISKNLAPLEVFPCRIADGQLWVSLE